MVDFDKSDTYPQEIKDWVRDNINYFIEVLSKFDYSEGWEVAYIVDDLCLENEDFVKEFVQENQDLDILVWHATRIENIDSFWEKGIRVVKGHNSDTENEYRLLLQRMGFDKNQENEVIEKASYYWKRDIVSRVGTIHFFYGKEFIRDPQLNQFAISLGGECIRWGIRDIDSQLYKQEPYKRLWIIGKPCIVQFKCKMRELSHISQYGMVKELIKYFIIYDICHLNYRMKVTGWKYGSVAPNHIQAIEEIHGFIECQEQFEDYQNFYDELKK